MDSFETISFDQARNLLRRHVNQAVTLVAPQVPGMSLQMTGQLFVQESDDYFAFAVAVAENISVTVVPFPDAAYQIPTGTGEVDALISALNGPEEQQAMLWMLRFEG